MCVMEHGQHVWFPVCACVKGWGWGMGRGPWQRQKTLFILNARCLIKHIENGLSEGDPSWELVFEVGVQKKAK